MSLGSVAYGGDGLAAGGVGPDYVLAVSVSGRWGCGARGRSGDAWMDSVFADGPAWHLVVHGVKMMLSWRRRWNRWCDVGCRRNG